MRMHLAMTGVDHQPFVIRLVNQDSKQLFPNPLVPPADKTTMRIAPPSVVRWQITPGRAGSQNPEDRIDKQAVVFGNAAPHAFASR